MTDDLVKKAREMAAAWEHRRDGGFMHSFVSELADRIEALSGEKTAWKNWHREQVKRAEAAEAEVMRRQLLLNENIARRVVAEAEVERLREALEEVENTDNGHAGTVARAALAAKEPPR